MGHIRHDLRHCFDMHLNYLEHGAMLPDLNLAQFGPHHAAAGDKGLNRKPGTNDLKEKETI